MDTRNGYADTNQGYRSDRPVGGSTKMGNFLLGDTEKLTQLPGARNIEEIKLMHDSEKP